MSQRSACDGRVGYITAVFMNGLRSVEADGGGGREAAPSPLSDVTPVQVCSVSGGAADSSGLLSAGMCAGLGI